MAMRISAVTQNKRHAIDVFDFVQQIWFQTALEND